MSVAAMLFLGLNTIVDGFFVGHYVGANALASVNIAMPLSSFMLALSVVVGIGTQSVIGRKLGEGNTTEANNAFKTALLVIAGSSLLFAFAIHGARLYAFAFLVNGLNIVASGYFTAIGSPKSAALIALSKGVVWITIGIVVLPVLLGIRGIWLTVPIAEIVTVILSTSLLYRHFKFQIQRN